MACRTRLKALLDGEKVPYQHLRHDTEYTSQEIAADTHTPGKKFAKIVVLRIGSKFALIVLPAPHRIDLELFKAELQLSDAALATEEEMKSLFPDAEVGAEPPFGNLYGLPVYVSPTLAESDWITFNAGTHQDAIRMRYDDFVRLVQPTKLQFRDF